MISPLHYAVPQGSLVVVTGANGFLGSHIAYQFLEYGYNVRGTVRNAGKNEWLAHLFKSKYGKDRFELCEVADLGAEGALDDIVQGATVVVHTASVISLSSNPNEVIPDSINYALVALRAAYKANTATRFVFTSSSSAAVLSLPNQPKIIVTEDTWNLDAIQKAWAEPPYTDDRTIFVYGASKAQAEQEVWRYHRQHQAERPDLVVNTILPNFNFGRSLDSSTQGWSGSSAFPYQLWKGEVTALHKLIAPQYYIDVDDTARLHVAAAVLTHVQGQRIFGSAGRFNWDRVLDVLRRHSPQRILPENFSSGEDPNEILPRDKAEQLLRDLGREGWTTLEESILKNIQGADSRD